MIRASVLLIWKYMHNVPPNRGANPQNPLTLQEYHFFVWEIKSVVKYVCIGSFDEAHVWFIAFLQLRFQYMAI